MDKETATAKAYTLVNQLNALTSPGWQMQVWENTGWHYAAIKLPWKIHPPKYDSNYSAYLAWERAGGYWWGSGATPFAAMQACLKRAEEEIEPKQSAYLMGKREWQSTPENTSSSSIG